MGNRAVAAVDLIGRVEQCAARTPSKQAFIRGDRALSYAELSTGAARLAGWLAEHATDDRSPIVIHGHKEPEMLIGMLGALRAGRPYVPVDTAVPRHRLESIVEAARARIVLTPERIAELTAGATANAPTFEPTEHTPVYIMFTSGSTGEPKGVPITHGNLASFLNWIVAEQSPRPDDVFLNQVPYSFDVSVMDTYQALLAGATIVSVSRDEIASPKHLFAALAASDLTVWVSTPSFAQVCLAEPRFGREMLPSVRTFLFCGETLPPEVAAQLLDRFPGAEVWNTYGPTEATVATTSIRIDRSVLERYSPLPIGCAMTGSRVLIVDAELRPIESGQRGEIVIAGPNVSPGYLYRPDLTAGAFFTLDGRPAYRTGDWGHEQDGLLFCDGRMDNQVKLHGHRIELGDVEANLRALPGVRDAVIVPIERPVAPGTVDGLGACVILAERGEASDFVLANTLRGLLAERVPVYMVPRRIRFVDRFPMTVNGKADRRAIERLFK